MGLVPVPIPSKETVKEIEAGGKWFFGIVQRVLRLSETQSAHAKTIDALAKDIKAQAAEIADLRDAVRMLQAREDVIIARAETAATKAATSTLTDLARRVGHIEERTKAR